MAAATTPDIASEFPTCSPPLPLAALLYPTSRLAKAPAWASPIKLHLKPVQSPLLYTLLSPTRAGLAGLQMTLKLTREPPPKLIMMAILLRLLAVATALSAPLDPGGVYLRKNGTPANAAVLLIKLTPN